MELIKPSGLRTRRWRLFNNRLPLPKVVSFLHLEHHKTMPKLTFRPSNLPQSQRASEIIPSIGLTGIDSGSGLPKDSIADSSVSRYSTMHRSLGCTGIVSCPLGNSSFIGIHPITSFPTQGLSPRSSPPGT